MSSSRRSTTTTTEESSSTSSTAPVEAGDLPARRSRNTILNSTAVRGESQNIADSNIFFYVMLTLVFLLSVLAIVLAVVSYVQATSQRIGPIGPPGPPGQIPAAQFFEQPAFYISQLTYTIGNDPKTQPRFLVFTGQPAPNIAIEVQMPPASAYNGKIFRFYNVQAEAGVLLLPAANDSAIIPQVFNPILPGYFAMAISDGASQWILNSSTETVIVTSATGP